MDFDVLPNNPRHPCKASPQGGEQSRSMRSTAPLAFVAGLVLAILIKGYDVAGLPRLLLRSSPIDVGRLHVDCGQNYTVEFLSVDPVVLYINNFLTGAEIQHLLRTYADDFEPSMVWDQNLSPSVNVQIRSSQTARVPSSDPVAMCLRNRIGRLLGNLQHIDMDQIQIVRYDPNEQIRLHCDWFSKKLPETTDSDPTPRRAYNRLSTLFVYLQDDCSGGETYFPAIQGVSANADTDKFGRSETGTGLLVKPRKGNAVFWMNMHMNGTGDRRVLHAGLPVHSGRKIGLNIFSRYYLDSPIIG